MREYRNQAKLTLAGLAERVRQIAPSAKVDESSLSRMERGRRLPRDREVVLHIARGLDASEVQTDNLLVAAGYMPVREEIEVATRLDAHWLIDLVNKLAHDDLTPSQKDRLEEMFTSSWFQDLVDKTVHEEDKRYRYLKTKCESLVAEVDDIFRMVDGDGVGASENVPDLCGGQP